MKLYIKYMVSMRCKALVKEELEKLGLQSEYIIVDLGMVNFLKEISEKQQEQLKENLSKSGNLSITRAKTRTYRPGNEGILNISGF